MTIRMLHHSGNMLEHASGYWTVVPNAERHAYRIGDVPAGSPEITIATIGKSDTNWRHVVTLPNLEELTLHEPSAEQLEALSDLPGLTRLRVTHAKLQTLDRLRPLKKTRELVLEYVSGFTDLSPLSAMTELRSAHFENLRRVSCFEGLPPSLAYLSIYGTLDWNQPIAVEFLRARERLEVLALWQVINKSPYPALLPASALASLKKLRVAPSYLAPEECALLEELFSGVDGGTFGPFKKLTYVWKPLPADDIRSRLPVDVINAHHPEILIRYDGTREIADPESEWFVFTRKGAGRAKCTSANADAKCRAYAERYDAMKQRARALLSGRGTP
jgi:hypothetical protein